VLTRISQVGLFATALALSSACARSKVEPPLPAPLVRSTLVGASVDPPLTLRGPVVAGSRLRLGFKSPGVVKAVLVKDGEAVKKGQVLARLDAADAWARARAAQSVRDRAKRAWQRAVKLSTRPGNLT
jgi:multidrug efflux pump subunit AcrA (membrane-fusion protein)